MRYGSVCSGIESATVAWAPLKWSAEFYSEIDPFASAVLKHHYPQTPNYGDITKHQEWKSGSIDLLVGGCPCQSFSVAGLRKGLADPRGNITLTYLGVIDQFRPRWIVYENVPGLLSEDGGRTFGTFLGGLAELGYGFAYRILDAQFVRVESHTRAVPQRRRRVFVVGYIGDWRRAAAVLFERESLRRDSPPSRNTRERIAPTLAARTRGGGGLGTDFDCDGGLIAREVAHAVVCHQSKGGDPTTDNYVVAIQAGVLDSAQGQAVAFDTTQITSKTNRSNPQSGDPCHTLTRGSHAPALATKSTVRRLTPMECSRLQAFPDDYCRIPYQGKPAEQCPDGPQYKAYGNAMACNVMRWIGERIQSVENIK